VEHAPYRSGLSPGKVPGAASELAAGSAEERTPATGGLIFLSLMRLARDLIPRLFPVRPVMGHTHACGADFRAPRQKAIKR
jgi:hypothetical protein